MFKKNASVSRLLDGRGCCGKPSARGWQALEPVSMLANNGLSWRECCEMAGSMAHSCLLYVSLWTDSTKLYQNNFLIQCIRKSEDLQDFRSECLLAQTSARHSNQARRALLPAGTRTRMHLKHKS